MKLFASTILYAAGKSLGMVGALNAFKMQLEKPGSESWPVSRALARLQHLADVQLFVDTGGTCIGKGRARAFHEALESDCDAWVSLDDDVEVTTDCAASMIEVLSDELAARVVVVPFVLRGVGSPLLTQARRVNVNLPLIRTERFVAGAKLQPLERGTAAGFGMVGMNRRALARIAEHHKELFLDDDGRVKLALFHDELADGKWYGEDVSFFRSLPDDIELDALLVGTSLHAGETLELGKL
jgi:GT2 family glycosyltransferase